MKNTKIIQYIILFPCNHHQGRDLSVSRNSLNIHLIMHINLKYELWKQMIKCIPALRLPYNFPISSFSIIAPISSTATVSFST